MCHASLKKTTYTSSHSDLSEEMFLEFFTGVLCATVFYICFPRAFFWVRLAPSMLWFAREYIKLTWNSSSAPVQGGTTSEESVGGLPRRHIPPPSTDRFGRGTKSRP